MSSSKGIVLAIEDMTAVMPPEVLRYLIMRTKPNQAIDFDPCHKMIQIVDEFESLERRILCPEPGADPVSEAACRNYSLARIHPEKPRIPVQIPFRLLTTLIQVAAGDEERLKAVLVRTGYGEELQRWPQVKDLAEYAEKWLNQFAPDDAKMQLAEEMPKEAQSLSEAQARFLNQLADYLAGDPNADEIHQQVYTLAEGLEIPAQEAFRSIYLALIGKERGPRAGFFLASLEKEFIDKRFREVYKVIVGMDGKPT